LVLLAWIEPTYADVVVRLSELDSRRAAPIVGDASNAERLKVLTINGARATAKLRDKVSDQLWARASRTVTEVLEQQHYLQQPLGDAVSRRALDRYFEALDPERLYFLEPDLLRFRERFGSGFAKAMHDGKWEVIDEVTGVLGKRKADCAVWLKELLSQNWEFVDPWEVELSREHSDWPADEAEAKRVWREQLGSELIAEVLDGVDLETAIERVRSKYAADLQPPAASRGERIAPALAALARACDPHSDYLTQEEFEDAESELNLTRIGIGVTVDKDPLGLKVVSIMAGGPAQRDGRLRVNDRIVAIASDATPFRELAGLSFSESVRLLRGKAGELVRLKVAPARSGDPGARLVVAIVREQMRSHEGEAYAKILHATRDGETRRYGWVVAPAFYGNESGAPGGRSSSVARDVAGLVKRLKAETVAGIVLDLRGNLGGLLEEAVELGGLFCGSVPIAAVRIPKEPIEVMAPVKYRKQLYDGPLVVLVDHESASASEIVAGALQDHARAVVVGGEQTFGKGSVQASIPLSELMHLRKRPPLGGMLLTIGKFYRVNGQSTQKVGTRPDIVLPSTADIPSRGESGLAGCLEHDAIEPVRGQMAGVVSLSMLQTLGGLSSSRVAQSEAFALIREEHQRLKQQEQKNRLSLQESERRQNAILEEKRYGALQSASAVSLASKGALKFQRLLIEDLRAKKLPLLDQDPLANSDPEGLAVEIETLEILADMAALWGHR
jgi:carboxyl-terminal processing protease